MGDAFHKYSVEWTDTDRWGSWVFSTNSSVYFCYYFIILCPLLHCPPLHHPSPSAVLPHPECGGGRDDLLQRLLHQQAPPQALVWRQGPWCHRLLVGPGALVPNLEPHSQQWGGCCPQGQLCQGVENQTRPMKQKCAMGSSVKRKRKKQSKMLHFKWAYFISCCCRAWFFWGVGVDNRFFLHRFEEKVRAYCVILTSRGLLSHTIKTPVNHLLR